MGMTGHCRFERGRLLLRASAGLRTAALAAPLLMAFSALAQVNQQLNQQGNPKAGQPPAASEPAGDTPAQPAPDPSFKPGFIDALGRWIGDSKAAIDSQLKTTQDAIGDVGSHATGVVKDAAGAAQQATGAVVGLPGTRLITGRQRCPAAANGAPDCGPAADALCQSKGFGSGRGVEVAAGQSCSARTWLTRRNPSAGPCATETYVTRAVCQ
jgi:hypothetical protein